MCGRWRRLELLMLPAMLAAAALLAQQRVHAFRVCHPDRRLIHPPPGLVVWAVASIDSEDGTEPDDEGEALWWKPAVPTVSAVLSYMPDYWNATRFIGYATDPVDQNENMLQTRFVARIAYDGTRFNGWQYQVKSRTVQLEIERALNATLPVRNALVDRDD